MRRGSLRAVAGVALIVAVTGAAIANTAEAQADLALAMELAGGVRAAVAGDLLSLTLEVSNNGSGDAEDVVATTLLARALTYQGSSGEGWVCGEATQMVTCELAGLASGQVSTLILLVQSPDEPAIVWTTAEVSSSTADPNDRNNRAELFFPVVLPEADLWLQKEVSTDPIQPGAIFSYTVTVGNNGPREAEAVIVTDTLPAEMQLVSIEVSQGTCSDTACSMGTLPTDAMAAMTVTVAAPSSEGVYTNTARATSETLDPVSGNNETAEAVRVRVYRIYLPRIWRVFPAIFTKRG